MLSIIVLLFLVVPITIFLHECGHIIIAKLMKLDGLEIVIGSGPSLLLFFVIGIKVQINMVYFVGGYSTNTSVQEIKEWQKGLISLGGPLLNLFLAIVFFMLFNMNHMVDELLVLFNVWVGIVNLIPYKLMKKESDGYVFVKSMYHELKAANTK
ncbi:site-2 protease family protein [Litchfieldia salsa]|uniref:Peptidase family M50 n=1 Tax=Litchfieldia salsa TaxID=930152 RepID=A0A1H0WPA0_9BACI|nr:site-2 protease family protein [Litchfieldia salsa]SDP92488.1 Peptidase family M50 [Litchfieldia salsa]